MDDSEIAAVSTSLGSSSLGDAASARGHNVSMEDDDELYYIPERRPSLDLGQELSTMETSLWLYMDQALSPAQSYCSMISEDFHQSDEMQHEDGSSTSVHLERTDSYSSCYSLDSDDCEKRTRKVRSKDHNISQLPERPELVRDPNVIRHPSLTVAFMFKTLSKTLEKLSEVDISKFKWMLWKRYPEAFNTSPQSMDLVDLVDRLLECYGLEVSMQVTKTLLEEMRKSKMVEYLQTLCLRNEVRYDLCVTLKRKYIDEYEDWNTHEEKKTIDSVFTNLYISSTCDNGPNTEHEVMHIGKLHTNRAKEKPYSHKDILSAEMMESLNTTLILTTGMAGTGKSTAVRKVIMDWVEERSHQHVSFMFPLPFRELKAFESSKVSLVDIIQTLYPETKRLRDEDYKSEDCKMMLIFDGLDEYKGTLDFHNTELLSEHTEASSLQVMVVNLLRGRLLYHGLVWITSRPQVKSCIPRDVHYEEAELRGFRDSDKEEYFKKRFEDPEQAARVIAHLKSCKTLHIMCHLPLFCSVLGDEFQRSFERRGPRAELPRSITPVYTKLLSMLLRSRTFRAPAHSPQEQRDFLMKLGKLAFDMLEQGQVKILKSDWKEFGLSAEEAVLNSGLCTQFTTEPMILYHEKVICFLHITMQEYMAALYAFLSFRDHGKNVFEHQLKGKLSRVFKGSKELELYKSAVDRSVLYEDGRLDIFLHFLVGMALEANQELFEPLCASSAKWSSLAEDIATLIRKKIRENQHPDRNSSLQRCLEELRYGASAVESS
ncbi:hypothetical protein LDENG_00047140 [Lucifuga dentata]|nr:hypothetical protein LDENG_00047140 [Lucifuga dentata]